MTHVFKRDMAQAKCRIAEAVIHSVLGGGPRACTEEAAAQQGFEGSFFPDGLKSIIFPLQFYHLIHSYRLENCDFKKKTLFLHVRTVLEKIPDKAVSY